MGIRSRIRENLKWMWQPIGYGPTGKNAPKEESRVNRQPILRGFSGTAGGRLTADWITSGTSADAELQGRLPKLRNNARDMCRNTPYAAQLKRLYRDNIIGPAGIQLQMKVPRLRGGGLDEAANTSIESGFKRWCRADSCDVRGQSSLLAMSWFAAMASVDSGEIIFRIVRQAFGKDNKIPIALEMIEPDQLDLMYVGPLKASDNQWRMGIERDKWGRAVTYAILTSHPGDYLTTSRSVANRYKHDLVDANDIIHVFFPDRINQSRGYPILAPVMADAHQTDGYEEAVTVRARAAASVMGFIRTPEGEQRADGIEGEGETAQRVTESQPGVWKYLAPGEEPIIPEIKAPDNQYEMFVKNKGKRYAAGVGVSYSTITRDAGEASYSSERQQYLQDQDAWSVLQQIIIEQLHDRVFREWLPVAVLAGAVTAPDFYVRPNRYYDAAQWQPRGWSWVDPKKEAEGYVIMEQQGYISKMEICAMRGTDYETVLKDRQRQRELERQYSDSATVEEIVAAPGQAPPDSSGGESQ